MAFRVVLRRVDGQLIKTSRWQRSKYAAKKIRRAWEEKYDLTFIIEIERSEDE